MPRPFHGDDHLRDHLAWARRRLALIVAVGVGLVAVIWVGRGPAAAGLAALIIAAALVTPLRSHRRLVRMAEEPPPGP